MILSEDHTQHLSNNEFQGELDNLKYVFHFYFIFHFKWKWNCLEMMSGNQFNMFLYSRLEELSG